jgi:hypothetical protein
MTLGIRSICETASKTLTVPATHVHAEGVSPHERHLQRGEVDDARDPVLVERLLDRGESDAAFDDLEPVDVVAEHGSEMRRREA